MVNKPRYTPQEIKRAQRRIPWRKLSLFAGGLALAVAVIAIGSYGYQRFKQSREAASATLQAPPPPDKPAEPTIALPKALGGSVRLSSLAKLITVASEHNLNPGHLRLSLKGGARATPATFAIGKSFTISVSSTENCYYAVIHHNADGTFQLVDPIAAPGSEESGKLQKGETRELTVHTTPPAGKQEFLFVCTPAPIELDKVLSADPNTYGQFLAATVYPYIAPQQ